MIRLSLGEVGYAEDVIVLHLSTFWVQLERPSPSSSSSFRKYVLFWAQARYHETEEV